MQTTLFDTELALPSERPGEELVGVLQSIAFADEEERFVVASVRCPSRGKLSRVVAAESGPLRVGMRVCLTGAWEQDARWGRQFRVRSVVSALPSEVEGVCRYIEANVHGCGPARSRRIVDVLGPDALLLLAESTDPLDRVFAEGRIREAQKQVWSLWRERYHEDRATEDVLAQLLDVPAIGGAAARRIVRQLGPARARAALESDPYALTKVRGIGFRLADEIARTRTVARDDPARLSAALSHALERAINHGHTGVPPDALIRSASALLPEVGSASIRQVLDRDLAEGTLVHEYGLIYRSREAAMEQRVAERLATLAARREPLDAADRMRVLALAGRDGLSSAQTEAVASALEYGLFALTGRPGAGKTTTVRTLISAAHALWGETNVAVCAPTGRAASRATEVTGIAATTVHRLIGAGWGQPKAEPIKECLVILDEGSLADLPLIDWLLANIDPLRTRLVLVGDVNQLASVGHGRVLGDVVGSQCIAGVDLTEIFRQGKGSLIKANAVRLLSGEPMDLATDIKQDFVFADVAMARPLGPDGFPLQDEGVSERECARALERLGGAIGHFQSMGALAARDIQVLAPMNGGRLGVHALNRWAQERLNPMGERGPRLGDSHVCRCGDRVLQMKNDYSLGLFNGDLGVVLRVSATEHWIEAEFSGRIVRIEKRALDHLSLGWAITVHRAQGSEFAYVAMVYHTVHYAMLSRPLLYTGITRARGQLVLIGSRWALDHTLRAGRRTELRHTALGARLDVLAEGTRGAA